MQTLSSHPFWRVIDPGVEEPIAGSTLTRVTGRREEYIGPTSYPMVDLLTPKADTQAAQQGVPVLAQAPVAPPAQPETANKWMQLFDALTQPDVLGPLQTFIAAATVPLRPGENFGSRLNYASMLMNLHRTMLQERAQEAPLLERERLAKIQRDEALARREAASADVAQQTVDTEVEAAKTRLRNAIKDGNLKEAELMLRELEMMMKQLKAGRYNEMLDAELAQLRAQTAKLQRDARAPYATARPVEDKAAMELEKARNYYNGAVKAYEAARKAGMLAPGMTFELWLSDPTSPYYDRSDKVLSAKAQLEAAGLLQPPPPTKLQPTYRFKDGKFLPGDEPPTR